MSAGRKTRKPPRAGPKKKAAERPEMRSMGRAKKPVKQVVLPRRKKRQVAEKPRRIVPAELVDLGRKKVMEWVLQQYFKRGKPVEYLAHEIGVTRPGLSKVLRRKGDFLFTTFLRTCFLQTSGDAVLVIAAEGCKIELRWVIEQGNDRFVSERGNRR